MRGRFFRLLLLLNFLWQASLSGAQTANRQLSLVAAKLSKANNYKVDANIKVDLPFITMAPISATIYFKQKDKFKVVSKSIAVLPKQGFVQLMRLIDDTSSYTAVYQGTEVINGNRIRIVSVIPMSDTGDVVLGKLWIDEAQHLVMKSQITSKQNGTMLTTYLYGAQKAYALPDEMIFEVDVKKFKVPKAIAADIHTSTPGNSVKPGKKGIIIIKLQNYSINKGIDDTIFKK